jgi:hypothetical protein
MLTYASLYFIHRAEAQVSARQVEEQALRDAGGAYAYAGGAAGAAAAPEARASDVRLSWKYSQVCSIECSMEKRTCSIEKRTSACVSV